MIPTSVQEVALQCQGKLDVDCCSQAHDALVTSVVTDNRQVTPGALFVAIKGERVDGNRFANDALARGALAVLTEDPAAACASGVKAQYIISVPNIERALAFFAQAQLAKLRECGNPDLKVVAVTGSVGKTTTKDLMAALFAERGELIAPPGSFNNDLGLPLTVLRATADTATLVLEMGASSIGDIERLVTIAPPDMAIVLIVAPAHVGEFGGIEAIARAKAEIITGAREEAPIILNADDVRVVAMSDYARGPITYFSSRGRELEAGLEAQVYATDITIDPQGHASFTLHTPAGEGLVCLALVGAHHVSNALAAASAATVLGVPFDHIVQVLTTVGAASAHRMAVSDCNGFTLIDDSYNANPASMRAGIDALTLIGKGKRTVAVLGQMLELGDEHNVEHSRLGEYIVKAGVCDLVAVGDGLVALADAAKAAGLDNVYCVSAEEAQAFLQSFLCAGDVVLMKGSHSSGIYALADILMESAQGDDVKGESA